MKDNRTRFDSSRMTLPKIFQQNGYQTAIIGKWHLISYPTGFDYWKILPGQGLYVEPRFISMKGDTTTYHGYATDVITDEAIKWLDNMDYVIVVLDGTKDPYSQVNITIIGNLQARNIPVLIAANKI